MEESKKLYYSISEVAEMFNINQSTLRFWERKFGFPKPRTNEKGKRFYTEKDIEEIRTLHYLLRGQKLTITGAKEKLKSSKKDSIKRNAEIVDKLSEVKRKLVEIERFLAP